MQIEKTPTVEQVNFRPSTAVDQRSIRQPTAEQARRRAQLKRFNRLVIGLPVGLVALLWLALILGMIWLSVAGEWFAMDTNQAYYRQLLSGVADVLTMLLLAPILLLCALPIVGVIALLVYRRRKRADSASAEPSLPIFWRIENKVSAVRDGVGRAMPRLARPVINAHATAAFVRQSFFELRRILRQENIGNDDER